MPRPERNNSVLKGLSGELITGLSRLSKSQITTDTPIMPDNNPGCQGGKINFMDNGTIHVQDRRDAQRLNDNGHKVTVNPHGGYTVKMNPDQKSRCKNPAKRTQRNRQTILKQVENTNANLVKEINEHPENFSKREQIWASLQDPETGYPFEFSGEY
jgi:hypothetical protein